MHNLTGLVSVIALRMFHAIAVGCFVLMSACCHDVGKHCQDDNTFEWSKDEPRPTRRSLSGVWWNDHWEAIKAIRARRDDGTEKAAQCVCVCVVSRRLCPDV